MFGPSPTGTRLTATPSSNKLTDFPTDSPRARSDFVAPSGFSQLNNIFKPGSPQLPKLQVKHHVPDAAAHEELPTSPYQVPRTSINMQEYFRSRPEYMGGSFAGTRERQEQGESKMLEGRDADDLLQWGQPSGMRYHAGLPSESIFDQVLREKAGQSRPGDEPQDAKLSKAPVEVDVAAFDPMGAMMHLHPHFQGHMVVPGQMKPIGYMAAAAPNVQLQAHVMAQARQATVAQAVPQMFVQTTAQAPLPIQTQTAAKVQIQRFPVPNRFAPQALPPFHQNRPPPAEPVLVPGNASISSRINN